MLVFTEFQQTEIGLTHVIVISKMVNRSSQSRWKHLNIGNRGDWISGYKCNACLGKAAIQDSLQRNGYAALEKDRQMAAECLGIALLCGDADFPHSVRGFYIVAEDADGFSLENRRFIRLFGAGVFDLLAPVFQTALNQGKLLDFFFNDPELILEKQNTVFRCIVCHVVFNLV